MMSRCPSLLRSARRGKLPNTLQLTTHVKLMFTTIKTVVVSSLISSLLHHPLLPLLQLFEVSLTGARRQRPALVYTLGLLSSQPATPGSPLTLQSSQGRPIRDGKVFSVNCHTPATPIRSPSDLLYILDPIGQPTRIG